MMYYAPARRYSLAQRCHDLIKENNIPAKEIHRMGPQSGSWSFNWITNKWNKFLKQDNALFDQHKLCLNYIT